jgi:TatA/E family protein of Tat protein translocase
VFNIGPLELAVVLIIALIVLGPQRLPDVARSMGRGMREFRSALENPDDEDDDVVLEEVDDEPAAEPAAGAAAAATAVGDHAELAAGDYQNDADSSESSSSSSERV